MTKANLLKCLSKFFVKQQMQSECAREISHIPTKNKNQAEINND